MHKFNSKTLVEINPFIKKAWSFIVIVFLLLGSMMFLPWQQTVKGEGKLIATDPTQREYKVLATIPGFIKEFYVHENQFVTKGTKIFDIEDIDSDYLLRLESIQKSSQNQFNYSLEQVENIKEKIENLEENLKLQKEVYAKKFLQSKDKTDSLSLKKQSLENKYEIEKLNFERIEVLYNDGIESKRNYELAQNRFIQVDAELKKAEIDINIEKNYLEILKKEEKKFKNEIKNKLKVLENLTLSSEIKGDSLSQDIQNNILNINRYKSGEVNAQKDGYVVRIYENDKHKLIDKGDPILLFSPKVTKRSLFLKVSDFNMPLIKEGLQTRIMFYGWPALQISGWPTIKYGTFAGIIKHVEPISHEKGFYYARIDEDPSEPWPDANVLRIGTQATVWVRLSTVPIWYQLWRLINAFPPHMVQPAQEKKI